MNIEGVNFHDNALAISTDASSYFKTKVWRSKFSQNGLDITNQSGQGKADARYNWWGDENGPVKCTVECGEFYPRPYQKLVGLVVPYFVTVAGEVETQY